MFRAPTTCGNAGLKMLVQRGTGQGDGKGAASMVMTSGGRITGLHHLARQPQCGLAAHRMADDDGRHLALHFAHEMIVDDGTVALLLQRPGQCRDADIVLLDIDAEPVQQDGERRLDRCCRDRLRRVLVFDRSGGNRACAVRRCRGGLRRGLRRGLPGRLSRCRRLGGRCPDDRRANDWRSRGATIGLGATGSRRAPPRCRESPAAGRRSAAASRVALRLATNRSSPRA